MKKLFFILLFSLFTINTYWFEFETSTSKYNNFLNDVQIMSYDNTSFYEKFSKNIEIIEEFRQIGIFADLEKYSDRLKEIPNKSDFENYLIEKIGENKFLNLLKNKDLSMHWIVNKCETYKNNYCETYKKLLTNTNITQQFNINKTDDKEVVLDIFPISDKKFDFDNYEAFTKSKLLFFDTSLEYYNMSLSVYWKSRSYVNFVKKHKLVKYNRWWEIFYAMVPYYQLKFDLDKWEHTLLLRYDKFTPFRHSLYSELQRIK